MGSLDVMDSNPNASSSAQAGAATPRLYGELASWWTLLSAPEEYEEEAAF